MAAQSSFMSKLLGAGASEPEASKVLKILGVPAARVETKASTDNETVEVKSEWVPEGYETVLTAVKPIPLNLNFASSLNAVAYGMKNKIFKLRVSRTATLTTSGTGTMLLSTAVDLPQFQEYAALAALFSQARLVSSRIQYADNQTSVGTVYKCSVLSAFHPTDHQSASIPVTAAAAAALPGVKLFSMANTNWPIVNHTPKLKRPFSLINSTGTSTDVMGGMSGSWWHALVNTGPVSTNIMTYIIEAEFEFKHQGAI
jgi:hypothetical protein